MLLYNTLQGTIHLALAPKEWRWSPERYFATLLIIFGGVFHLIFYYKHYNRVLYLLFNLFIEETCKHFLLHMREE